MLINNINFRNYANYFTSQDRAASKPEKPFNYGLACDTVNFSPKKSKKLGFSSQLLYKAHIKQFINGITDEFKLIPVKITRLMPNDHADIKAMKSISSLWDDTQYVTNITKDFEEKKSENRYLALEIDDHTKELKDRILCLAKIGSDPRTSIDPRNIDVQYIQSAPDAKHGLYNRYKGAGEVLLYGICKYARNLKFPTVTLESTNDAFYDHIRMPRLEKRTNWWYIFQGAEMDNFMERVEKKYQAK